MKLLSAAPHLLLVTLFSLGLAACGDKDEATEIDTSSGTNTEVPGNSPTLRSAAAPPRSAAPSPAPGAAPAEVAVDPGTVVLTVNGDPITQGEIDTELAGMLFGGMKVEPARLASFRKQFGPQAERKLLDQKLLQQAADAEGIKAPDDVMAERWKSIEMRIPAGMDKAAFLKSKGYSVEEADRQIRLVVRIEELLKRHASTEDVTDEAVRKYFDENSKQFETPEQVHARHILIKLPGSPTDEQKAEAKAQVEGFRQEVAEKGLPHFQELAKQHSGCPSGKQGGSLGFFGRGQMVPEFDKVAFELEPGVVSEPVLTQFGWHILLVDEKREAGLREFEDVKAQLKHRIEMEGKQKATKDYLDALRDAATIERPGETK